jgi:hypothetical protein
MIPAGPRLELRHNGAMKTPILVFALLAIAAGLVYAQVGFTVKPTEFPTFQYQIFDVNDSPTPPKAGSSALPGSTAGVRTDAAARVLSSSAHAKTPVQRADRTLENLCSEMGSRGFRLAHVLPRPGGVRAIFEKETPAQAKRPPRQ